MNTLTLSKPEDTKVLPSSLEAEQALLGAVIFDNEAFHLIDGVEPRHFSEPLHQRMWESIADRIGRGMQADMIWVWKRLEADPALLGFGGLEYISNLVDNAPPAFMAKSQADVVTDQFVRRSLKAAAAEIAAIAGDASVPAWDHLEAGEQLLYGLSERGPAGGGFADFSEALAGAMRMAAAAYDRGGALAGLSTGLIDIDSLLGGLHPSDLVILAGRPSMGKTALATNIAFNVARTGERVAFYSLEMSKEQLAGRILADVSGVPSDAVRQGKITADDFRRLRAAEEEISSVPLHIDATGGLPIGKLMARARRLHRRQGLALIVVDYLQLVTGNGKSDNRVQEVSMITQGLKALAKELNVPVLALSQLSRQVEQREDKRPQLSDLRESGSIEQDADAVAFVYREEYYLGRSEPREGTAEHLDWCEAMSKVQSVAEVIVGKQRHGPIGTVKLHFNASLTKFGNLARDDRYGQAVDFSEPRGGRHEG